jgi:hypothetical protein
VKAIFQSSIEHPWLNLKPIQAGEVPETFRAADCFVIIEDEDKLQMRIDIYGDSYSTFYDAIFWKHFVVIGWGYNVHFVEMENGNTKTISLESYFGYLYPSDDFLLVASGEKLFLFNEEAQLQWISDELGIDDVIVNQFNNELICGEGEWDPPGDWKAFQVRVDSGKSV